MEALKRLNELDKSEKLDLLRAIASKAINPKHLTNDTFVVTKEKEWFYALSVSASQVSGETLPVVFAGAAQKEINIFMDSIK